MNYIKFFLLLSFFTTGIKAQCDLSITNFNHETGELVVEAINSENCGCNEFTFEGTTCENSGSPHVNNNTTVSHIVLGLHVPEYDYNWLDCLTGVNHPGWTFKVFTLYGNQVLESGDTWSTNVFDTGASTNDCWTEILSNETLCTELVVWQINLSRTAFTEEGGWAVDPGFNQTQNYPDINLLNNTVLTCPLIFPGCTDPFALNYNDEATEDDDTCVYSIGPDPIIIELIVNTEECQVFDSGILSTFNYSATIVNIGTEAVTNFCLNDFLGTTFNCFNGVSNLAVWIEPGETITVYGNINAIGTWTAGQGNYMTITSVPGEIVTGNNNFVFYMPDGVDCELPPSLCDTVYVDIEVIEYITDTVTLIEVDTLVEYVQLPPDTVQVLEYIEIYINDTTYIYITDTLSIFEVLLIDCETGEECIDPPGISECWPWTIYIPNTFTPNNDGLNDVWQIVYDLDCWVDVEFRIFNRWGKMIYHGYDYNFNSYPFWDGSINGSDYYVSNGVYVYTFYGRKEGSPEILEESGHITIFR